MKMSEFGMSNIFRRIASIFIVLTFTFLLVQANPQDNLKSSSNFYTYLVSRPMIFYNNYFRNISLDSPVFKFFDAYKYFKERNNVKGMKICGLRALYEEKEHTILPEIIQYFIFEMPINSNKMKTDGIQKKYMDFCRNYNQYMFDKLHIYKLLKNSFKKDITNNLKIASTLQKNACVVDKANTKNYLHYSKFVLLLSNLFDLKLDINLNNCSHFYKHEDTRLSAQLLMAKSNKIEWNDVSWKYILSNSRMQLNCLLSKKHKIFKKNSELRYSYDFMKFPRNHDKFTCKKTNCKQLSETLQIVTSMTYKQAEKSQINIDDFKNFSFKNNLNSSKNNTPKKPIKNDHKKTDSALMIEQFAQNGNKKAQHAMAHAYFFGNKSQGFDTDRQKGLSYFKQIAEDDTNSDASIEMSILIITGKISGVSYQEKKKAVDVLHQATLKYQEIKEPNKKILDAFNTLGYLYYNGYEDIIKPNYDTSLNYTEIPAEKGHIGAMANFAALIFLTNKLEFKNKAINFLKESLKKNNSYALYISIYYLANQWATLEDLQVSCIEYSKNLQKNLAMMQSNEHLQSAYSLFGKNKYDEGIIHLLYTTFLGYNSHINNAIIDFFKNDYLTKYKLKHSKEAILLSLYANNYLNDNENSIIKLADIVYNKIKFKNSVLKKNYELAYNLYKYSIKQKIPYKHYAKFTVAWMQAEGLGAEKNVTKALKKLNNLLTQIYDGKEPLESLLPVQISKYYYKFKSQFEIFN